MNLTVSEILDEFAGDVVNWSEGVINDTKYKRYYVEAERQINELIKKARVQAKAEELHYLTTANIYTALMLHPDLLDKLRKREASYKAHLKETEVKDE